LIAYSKILAALPKILDKKLEAKLQEYNFVIGEAYYFLAAAGKYN